jgi:hypothetical protein
MSQIITAGSASPWYRVEDVPLPLRHLIGVPNFDTPANTSNQYFVSPEQLRAEAEAFRQLADDPYHSVPESARGALESLDEAAYRKAQGLAAMTQHNENPPNHYE